MIKAGNLCKNKSNLKLIVDFSPFKLPLKESNPPPFSRYASNLFNANVT